MKHAGFVAVLVTASLLTVGSLLGVWQVSATDIELSTANHNLDVASMTVSDSTGRFRFDLQGHRGARGLLPENSVPGFLRALEIGVTTLEMDVVISGDGHVIVSHEPWFSRRICLGPDGERIRRQEERKLRIYDMSYDQIAEYDCGSIGNSNFPDQEKKRVSKPRLSGVVEAVKEFHSGNGSPIQYSIEIKSRPKWDEIFHPPPPEYVEQVVDVLETEGIQSQTVIQSFDWRILREMHERHPEINLSLLVGPGLRNSPRRHVKRLGFVPTVYSPNHRMVTRRRLDAAHELGMDVIPWTVNKKARMKKLLEMGVDGIITDYPDRGAELLASD